MPNPKPLTKPAVTPKGAIQVGLNAVAPTHDIKLTDIDGNSLGLVLTDRMGIRNPTSVMTSSMPRTALRTSSGNTGYSDMELPFVYEVQSDWSNGRGNDEFGRNRSAYSDGYRCDTTKQYAICGPASSAQTGLGYGAISFTRDQPWDRWVTGGAEPKPLSPITYY